MEQNDKFRRPLPTTGRRDFLKTLGAAGGTLALPGALVARPQALEVRAEATIFCAPDDRVLVRFAVTGSSAPAGRLRIYDANRGLIGTAGVLPVAGRLYGEFWIPLAEPTRISTDLELPRMNPFRTSHLLYPPRKWTIHWAAAVGAGAIQSHLDAMQPEQRAQEIQLLGQRRLTINPVPDQVLDGLDLISAVAAMRRPLLLSHELGVDLGATAHADSAYISPSLPALLRASGVTRIITDNPEPEHWLAGPGGLRLLELGVGRMGNPDALGFSGGPAVMAPLIERFIENQHSDTTTSDYLVIAGGSQSANRQTRLDAVEEWNGMFAFPKIETTESDPPLDSSELDSIPVRVLLPRETPVPGAANLQAAAVLRVGAPAVDRMLTAAATALGTSRNDIGNAFALPVAGHMVFNGAPYTRSDVARLPDGGEFVATDVPPTGYAYFPGSPRTAVASTDSSRSASNRFFELEIDEATGAIASLRDANDVEWVSPGAGGWNSLRRCRLESTQRETIPGLGTRFRLDRWSTGRGSLNTVITLYNDLPWIDVSNHCEAVGRSAVEYRFGVAVAAPSVMWDLAVDRALAPAPVGRVTHDRYVTINGTDRAAYFRCYESPHFSVGSDGVLVSYGPRGICRFRLGAISDQRFDDDPQRFGWSGDPFVVVPAPGTGSSVSSTFGSILATNRRDVTIVGLKPADRPGDLIVYLQDQIGIGGNVLLQSGLIGFGSARQCDLLERDTGEELFPGGNGVPIIIEPRGLAAVRLTDLRPGTT